MEVKHEGVGWRALSNPWRVSRLESELRLSAAVGAAFSIALWLMGLPWIEWLVALAPLTVAPLGLAVALRTGERRSAAFHLAARLQPAGAALAAASFLLEAGSAAALLSSLWAGAATLAAAAGLGRLLRRAAMGARLFDGRLEALLPDDPFVRRVRRLKAMAEWVFRRRAEETAVDGGLVGLAVGAVWLTISRAGWTPLGFPEVIVLLTAAHFHYAGFAAALLAGLAGRRLKAVGTGGEGPLALSVAGVLAGSVVLAAGHVFSPLLELAGSGMLSLALVLLSSLVLLGGGLPDSGAARAMAAFSAMAPPVSMALAVLYAVGVCLGQSLISIPTMALWHGGLNALAFSLAGLLAWNLER